MTKYQAFYRVCSRLLTYTTLLLAISGMVVWAMVCVSLAIALEYEAHK